MAHVTGGGLAANLARVMPASSAPPSSAAPGRPQPVFDVVRRVGGVSQADLEATLNCGVGMVALTPPDDVDTAIEVLAGHGIRAWVAGEVRRRRRRTAAGSC